MSATLRVEDWTSVSRTRDKTEVPKSLHSHCTYPVRGIRLCSSTASTRGLPSCWPVRNERFETSLWDLARGITKENSKFPRRISHLSKPPSFLNLHGSDGNKFPKAVKYPPQSHLWEVWEAGKLGLNTSLLNTGRDYMQSRYHLTD